MKQLIFSNCYYCGSEPSNTYVTKRTGIQFRYNGVDRIDSSSGYFIGNVRPACKKCNLGKHVMSEADFYEWAETVVKVARSRALTK